MEVGLRVVRGRDWKFADQDGGEGRVGTVVEVGGGSGISGGPKNTVVVLWDVGVRANYRAGFQGCNDLRVLDNGPAGAVHESVTCDFCLVSHIRGIRWNCTQCQNFDLCHMCYHGSKHDLNHTFHRIDTPTSQRILVSARSKSKKIQAKGTFIGARVSRGANWVYANQDGGADKLGTVTEVTSVTNSTARSCVKIKWDAGETKNYRRGHEGKVEVKCTKEAIGEVYFVDHLPLLGDYAFNVIMKDDWVKLNESKLSAIDRLKMAAHIGQVARVLSMINQSASVRFSKSSSFTIPVIMLTKLRRFIRGDVVRITDNLQDAKRCQVGHGGWNEAMTTPLITTPMSRMRAYRECLVILGAGYLDNTLCASVLAAPTRNGQLGPFVSLNPTKDRRYFATITSVNDFVFVIGGQSAMAGDGSHATNSAFRYNPRDGKWLQISSMTVPRTHFALIAMPTCLIAVGGKHNRVALSTAERYDFATNEWSLIATLPNTLFSHAGCSHGNRVYISGGCPGEDFTDEMHSYDLDRAGWTLKAPMSQSRGYHVMVAHEGSLFVCAGNTNAGDRRDVTMTECYNIALDEWTMLAPSLHGQSEAPAVQCDNKIFILGGYSWDAHSFQDTVQVYDLDTDTWELSKNKLPEPMTGVVACHVKLQQRLFEDSLLG